MNFLKSWLKNNPVLTVLIPFAIVFILFLAFAIPEYVRGMNKVRRFYEDGKQAEIVKMKESEQR